jgi:small subunit ribosomal protein S8
MSMTDPIADLLTRIRNAQQARHDAVVVPASRLKESVVKILVQEGFVTGYKRLPKAPQDELTIDLKYSGDGRGAILGIDRESTPGRRVYVKVDDIPRVRHGLGLAIISTSKGVMADHHARKQRVGGEVLCTVW